MVANGAVPRVSQLLRQKREERGITLHDMAEQAGFSKGHLSQVETGKEAPSQKLISAYERILDVPGGYFLADAGRVEKLNNETAAAVAGMHRDIAQGLGMGDRDPVEEDGDTPSEQSLIPSLDPPKVSDLEAWVPSGPVIEGLWETLNAACELLQSAVGSDPPANGQQILISLRGEEEAFSRHRDLHKRWRSLLIEGLNRGWNIVHLRGVPGDRREAVKLIRYLIRNLLGRRGQYEPYYFSSATLSLAPPVPDMIIVPNQAGLLFLAAYQVDYFDSALVVENTAQLAMLRQAFLTGRASAEKLLQVFPRGSLAFEAMLSRKEANVQGDVLIKKDGLSTTLVPLSVLRAAINRCIERVRSEHSTDAERLIADLEFLYLEREERRKRLFARLDSNQRVLHIANKKMLGKLLEERKVSKDDWLLNRLPGQAVNGGGVLTPLEVATCLRRLVELIERYPNYELRLIEEDDPQGVELFMEIVGTDTALFEALDTSSGNQSSPRQVDLAILEPTTIKLLHDDYLNLWDRLTPDRDSVLAWINAQIHVFERVRS
ncbi:MAG TPA: helix-turn-helix transcriptional regulator [Chloroflexia bacterium]